MAAELGTSGADVLTPLALLLGLGSWLEPLLDRGPVRDITALRVLALAGDGSRLGRGEFVFELVVESMSFLGMGRCWTGMGGLRPGVVCDAAGAA